MHNYYKKILHIQILFPIKNSKKKSANIDNVYKVSKTMWNCRISK